MPNQLAKSLHEIAKQNRRPMPGGANADAIVKDLRTKSLYSDKANLEIMDLCMAAADLIESLATENTRLKADYSTERTKVRQFSDAAIDLTLARERLQSQLAASQRETQAAVEDMKSMALAMRESTELSEGCCFACAYDAQNLPDNVILAYGECPGYDRDDCFEWRGSQEAGKENHADNHV